jgi:phospholipid/cholesterol/gamma-HCH transport system substrate-binding protein
MKKAIRDHWRDFAAIIGLFVISLAVGGYILTQQRLRFPLIEDAPKRIKAEFSTAQAVTPGQGQTVRVSGVKIGDVGKVELKEGRALVTLEIDPEFKELVREDATALLRPKTALKDMFVELEPGDAPAPVAKEGYVIPVRNTLPDVNVDEFLSALDVDTREYLRLLINGAGEGLKGRGDDLRAVFKAFEPTHRDLARVTEKVAERRRNLRRLIRNLNVLNGELATKDDDLAQLVSSASRVFRAFASEDTNITQAIDELPETLRQTTQTLTKVETFAEVLRPSLNRLTPAVRKLDAANEALTPFAKEAAPIVRDQIRPFARDARPLVSELRVPARRLADSTPDLTRTFKVLDKFFNLLAYNENGREGPEKDDRSESYLYWLAWLNHNGNALFSSSSNTGVLRPAALQVTCATVKQTIAQEPELEFLQGLTPILFNERICPAG